MLARRFLGCIFILTLLVVIGAFLLFQFGQQVLVKQATPKGHFEAQAAGSAPDYAADSAWLSKPGLERDPSQWVPENEVLTLQPTRAELFYVHPTTYLKTDRWNAPLAGDGDADPRAELFVRSQASAFNQSANIWAPRYRQAAYGAFLLKSEDATKALDLAYGDVRAAFDRFIAAIPAGRPIIVAGHSQGSLHLLRLLAERKQVLGGRLVAAYVGGWPVGRTSDLPATGLPACGAATATGCLLSWQSFGEPANTDLVTKAWVGTNGLTGAKRTWSEMVCTNPVTGTDQPSAASSNPGTLVPSGDLSNATLEPGRVGARCERGFLTLSGDIPNLGPFVLPGNNYHVYDYALFWAAIRADAARRLKAWEAQ